MRIRDLGVARKDDDCVVFTMVDSLYATVECREDGLYCWFRDQFKIRHPNWRVLQKKMPGWKGFINYVTPEGLFPLGLMERAINAIERAGYNWHFEPEMGRLHDNAVTPERVERLATSILDESGLELRDYQAEALYLMLKYKRCVIESGVGSGKSLMIYLFVRTMLMRGLRVLIVVPNTGLVNQLFSNFIDDYNWKETGDFCNVVYSGVRYDKDAPVLISTWQSLVDKPCEFFKGFGCLIIDEAHGAKADSLISIARMCVNADYRIGATGTMPDDDLSILNIEGHLGKQVFSLMAGELVARGILSVFKINAIRILNGQHLPGTYAEEIDIVETLPARNAVILRIIRKKTLPTENVVVLFKKRAHLETIYEACKAEFGDTRKIVVIHGGIKADIREAIRKAMIAEGGYLLLATYQTMSEGINIPRLDHIIFASPYKAKIKVMQSLGRVLRKHAEKAIATLWDLVDEYLGAKNDSYTWKHYRQRQTYYKANAFSMEEHVVDIRAHTSVENKNSSKFVKEESK